MRFVGYPSILLEVLLEPCTVKSDNEYKEYSSIPQFVLISYMMIAAIYHHPDSKHQIYWCKK